VRQTNLVRPRPQNVTQRHHGYRTFAPPLLQNFTLHCLFKGKGGPYSTAERRVSELIPVLGRQPAGDVSHKPGGKLPSLFARPAITLTTLKRVLPISLLGEQKHIGVNSLPKTVTRQRRGCNLKF